MVAILGLTVLVVVVVMVDIDLMEGNGAHRFVSLFALGGCRPAHVQASDLSLSLLFCELSLDLLEKGLLFVYWIWFGWNMTSFILLPPHHKP